jgi:hypothetical protein
MITLILYYLSVIEFRQNQSKYPENIWKKKNLIKYFKYAENIFK